MITNSGNTLLDMIPEITQETSLMEDLSILTRNSGHLEGHQSFRKKLFGHNYCNYITSGDYSDSNHKDNIKRRLIGKVNKESITMGNTKCEALLDSGSVISCISK